MEHYCWAVYFDASIGTDKILALGNRLRHNSSPGLIGFAYLTAIEVDSPEIWPECLSFKTAADISAGTLTAVFGHSAEKIVSTHLILTIPRKEMNLSGKSVRIKRVEAAHERSFETIGFVPESGDPDHPGTFSALLARAAAH